MRKSSQDTGHDVLVLKSQNKGNLKKQAICQNCHFGQFPLSSRYQFLPHNRKLSQPDRQPCKASIFPSYSCKHKTQYHRKCGAYIEKQHKCADRVRSVGRLGLLGIISTVELYPVHNGYNMKGVKMFIPCRVYTNRSVSRILGVRMWSLSLDT